MSYLYASNLDPLSGVDQIEIMLDNGDTALLTMGKRYDLTAAEAARASRYITLVASDLPAVEDPVGIVRLPVKGNPSSGQVPTWDENEAAFVPAAQAGGGAGGPQPVNVRSPQGAFAGAVGNGVADDTAAFQRAQAAAEAAMVPLYIPGTPNGYKISASIAVDAHGARVFGDGPRESVINVTTDADAVFTVGSGTGTCFNVSISLLGIVGNATTPYGIRINDQASRSSIRHCRITSFAAGAAIGMPEDTATPSKFSWVIEDCELTGNQRGMFVRGRHQHLTIRECRIFNNTLWGLDIEGDTGTIAGGRVNIIGTQVEKNGTVADTTGSIRLAGVDVVNIDSWYNEQDATWPGCSILIDQDETGVSCSEVEISHSYLLGNNLATKGIIARYVNGLTLRKNRGLNFTTDVFSYEPGSVTRTREEGNYWNTGNLDLAIGPPAAYTPVAPSLTAIGASGDWYSAAFTVRELRLVTTARFVVATQSGNIEIAIYDSTGARLATTGSFLTPGAGARTQALTSNLLLRPEKLYYAVVTTNNATAALYFISYAGTQGFFNTLGLTGSGTGASVPLPATLTMPGAAVSREYVVAFS